MSTRAEELLDEIEARLRGAGSLQVDHGGSARDLVEQTEHLLEEARWRIHACLSAIDRARALQQIPRSTR